MKNELSFLGKGWSFPPTFSKNGAFIEMVTEEKDIRQSLKILLSTSVGERLMHPGFGCELKQFQFEEVTQALITSIEDVIKDALLNYEPRINLNKISITQGEKHASVLLITVDYTIRATNNRANLVYPFYLQEADSVNIGLIS